MSYAIALYTGGKDSHYAIIKSIKSGMKIKSVVIVLSRNPESWMFHTVNIGWSVLHTKIMGLPYHIIEVSGEKEAEIDELKESLGNLIADMREVSYIVTGAEHRSTRRIGLTV